MTERLCYRRETEQLNRSNMKRTAVVVGITLITMAGEIAYGLITGSMALLADGIHMGTHTFALIVTLTAYLIAGRHFHNPNFAFSSGKVGVLGGYTNAIILGLTAIYMVYEAVKRLISPEPIIFNQALVVAVLGLTVNLISAALLSSGGHDPHHGKDPHHDHNLRSAYIHVITDAMTSVLAIAALLAGKLFGQTWPDALVAILGAAVILKWAYGLLVDTGKLLVDYYPAAGDSEKIHALAGEADAKIRDLHIWKTSEKSKAVILRLNAAEPLDRKALKERISRECGCSHVTLEID